MRIEVSGSGLPERAVRDLAEAVVAREQAELERVAVSFVTEAAIADLNQRHRDQSGSTDVLSYPFDRSFPHGKGGEVIIAPSVVARLAKRDGRESEAALRETVVHGLLHLLGYQDKTAAEASRMARRTELILERA